MVSHTKRDSVSVVPKLPFYGRGIVLTRSGHLRYSSPKSKRGKYVHRDIVESLLAATPYSIQLLLPWPYEVHHIDYNKTHNHPSNFLLLSEAFHSALTADRPRNGSTGKFKPKWSKPPEWLPLLDEQVPF